MSYEVHVSDEKKELRPAGKVSVLKFKSGMLGEPELDRVLSQAHSLHPIRELWIEKGAMMAMRHADVNGVRIAYSVRGSGPPLVLIMGYRLSSRAWPRDFIEKLAERFTVVAFDNRGTGDSDKPTTGYEIANMARDVCGLVDHLEIPRANILGYSMGGAIAQLVARERPDLVAGMVLCATAAHLPVGPGGGGPLEAALAVAASGARLGGHVTHFPTAPVRLAAGAIRSLRATTPTDFVQWAVDELRRHDVRTLLEAARASSRHDAREWIGDVRTPAAVVLTARDRLVPPERQLETAELLGASVHEVEGGHAVCTRDRFVGPLVDACRAVTRH